MIDLLFVFQRAMFHHVILTFAVLGVVINVVAFVIISKKKDKSMFHDLLKILTGSSGDTISWKVRDVVRKGATSA